MKNVYLKQDQTEERQQTIYSNFIFILFSSVIFFVFSLYFTGTISLLFKQPITQFQFYLSIILTLLYTLFINWFIGKKTGKLLFQASAKISAALFFIVLFCFTFAGFFTDLSYDGQGYHQAGIVALNKGWNPYYENIQGRKDIKSENKLWIESYPHSSNIQSLVVFKVTKNIEISKAINLILVLVSGAMLYLALLQFEKLNMILRYLIVIISVLNPINILQIFTFGLDTQFYSYIIILLSLFFLIFKKYHLPIVYTNLFFITVLLINNKLTSIIYFGFFTAIFGLFLLLKKQYKTILQFSLVSIVYISLALTIFGFQPFITNYQNHKTPFYPVYASSEKYEKPYDFSENRPSNYLDENQVSLFVKSLFFETNGSFRAPDDKAEFKIPFTYKQKEINAFIFLGPKQGGFGVLFSGIIVLLLALFIRTLTLYKILLKHKKSVLYFGIAISAVVLSSLINPLNNVARYIPQFWLIIPLFVLAGSLLKDRISIFLVSCIVFFSFINGILIFSRTSSYNINKSIQISDYLKKLSADSKLSPVKVNFAQSEGNEFLLDRYNVNYISDEGLSSNFNCDTGFKVEQLLGNIGIGSSKVCINKL